MFQKVRNIPFILALVAAFLLPAAAVSSQEYEGMQGVTSANAVFDFRIGDSDVAMGHLNLIHSMVNDPAMVMDGRKPEIVVVFIGPSVQLITTEKKENAEGRDAIARKISAMDAEGVEFIVCMTAAHAFDVPEDSILPQIRKVQNGWVSIIGYQKNGYAMVADF